MKSKLFIAIALLLLLCVNTGCGGGGEKQLEVKGFLTKKFNAYEIKTEKKGTPILGESLNYYCLFSNKDGKNFFGIISSDFKKYIIINNDTIVNDNQEELKTTYKSVIDSVTYNIESDNTCKVNYLVENIIIKKVDSNIKKMFENGQIGVIELTKNYEYTDKSKENVVGPKTAKSIVLFDTKNNCTYEFNSNNM